MSKRAVILAAGMGTRLVGRDEAPKPLKPVAGVPLLVRILRTLASEGVREAAVVVGWRGELIRQALRREPLDLRVRFIENRDFQKKNGVSLLAAADFVDSAGSADGCLLSMADHLYSPEVVRRLRAFSLPAGACALGVDYDIGRCFDIDDATKVGLADDGRIVRIAKELPSYDALDCGVFRIGPSLVRELDAVHTAKGDCSLSEGVGALAASGRMFGCDIGDASWIDVDTPEAAVEAEAMLLALGDDLDAGRPSHFYLERRARVAGLAVSA